MTSHPRVVIAGGGTTGHIAPMLALGHALRRREPDIDIRMVGTPEGLETRLVPAAGFELATVAKVPAPRALNASVLRFPAKLAGSIRDMDRIIAGADAVVGVGGYVSTPAYLAAKRRGLPIVIHEANARPGLANRLGARLTSRVACAFPGTPLRGARVIGMPMRTEVSGLDRDAARGPAALALGLDPSRPTLVVTGGSLGAAKLNEAFALSAPLLESRGLQVLHITGAGKSEEVRAATRDQPHYHVVDYVDRMEEAYAVADLIVCRAGAGTVSEVSAVGLPAVYVPLAIGNGEQKLNAAGVVDAGGALLFENAAFSAATIETAIVPLLSDADERERMSSVAWNQGIRDADERLADMVFDAITGGQR